MHAVVSLIEDSSLRFCKCFECYCAFTARTQRLVEATLSPWLLPNIPVEHAEVGGFVEVVVADVGCGFQIGDGPS